MLVHKTDSSGNNALYAETLIETIAADITLEESDSGKVYLVGTDALTITLPATKAGVKYTFINSGADGNNIITISPAAADGIFGSISASAGGNADATTADGLVSKLSGTDNKDLINTKATANKGDRVTIIGDGAAGWYVIEGVGIWASEA